MFRVPAPHVVAARAYKITSPSTSGGSTALYRLSRLLNQGSKNQIISDDTNVTRRLSWERLVEIDQIPFLFVRFVD